MNTKQYFLGTKAAELAGINKSQFDNFKKAGLIEYKRRYDLKDIIYISFCNSFTVYNWRWTTLTKFFDLFPNRIDSIKNLDFLNNDVLLIVINVNNKNILYLKKNEKLALNDYVTIESKWDEKDTKTDLTVISNNTFTNSMGTDYYIINLRKIMLEIVERSKNLDLKVDVESILKTA